jgi:chromosome segregation ATPase
VAAALSPSKEQVTFAAYKQFCDDTSVEKQRAIAEANERIDVLKADIQKYTADPAGLTKEIAELDADISIWNGDIKAATNVRDIEKSDYDATHKDYSESVDALQRAIAVLKKQAFDRKQKASLAQVSALKDLNLIPASAKKTIDLFLQQGEAEPEGLEYSAPEANAYEFQSGGIVALLKKLKDEFREKLADWNSYAFASGAEYSDGSSSSIIPMKAVTIACAFAGN